MTQIFISYSRKDESFAHRLADDLTAQGINVWIDVKKIHPGEDWSDAIERGLQTSDILLLILSPDSTASEIVGNEWKSFAQQQGKTIIPILYRDAQIPFRLTTKQYIDFRSSDKQTIDPQAFLKLLTALHSVKSGGNADQQPSPPLLPHEPNKTGQPGKGKPASVLTGVIAVIVVVIAAAVILLNSMSANNTASTQTAVAANLSTATSTSAPSVTPTIPTATRFPPTATNTLPPPSPSSTPTATVTSSHTPTVPTRTSTATSTIPTTTPTQTASPTFTQTPLPPTQTPTSTPAATDTPPMIALRATSVPTTSPTVTPTNLPTLPTVSDARCTATVKPDGDLTQLNVVRNTPLYSSPPVRSVRPKQVVLVLEKALEGSRTVWYRIADEQSAEIGWILEDYLDLSKSCPQ